MIDVCVLGAGPAGATLAARLVELGHRVAIAEQHAFPRPHIGESLSPGIWPLLATLGVEQRVAAHGFVRTREARIRWRGDEEEREEVEGGLTVERGAFDAILLARAVEAGAELAGPARVRPPARADGAWSVPLGDRVLRARFVADATGRRRLLGGRRVPASARTLALHARWTAEPAADNAETRIAALPDGWLWGARLPGGGFRAIAFADTEALATAGRDRRRLLTRMLAASPTFADLAPPAAVAACDATSYAALEPIAATSVKVGEAAFAIDPLSSCGVQTALQTGLAAAAAVHTILGAGDADAAISYYAAQQRHAVARHAATSADVYAEHRPHAAAPFWRRRSKIVPAPAQRAVALAPLLSRPVRLSAGAELSATGCIVGERVELRRALAHPALERPVAFLGGSELAPLLDQLGAAPTLAAALGAWEGSVGPARAREVAAWLARRGLIEDAQAAITPVSAGSDGAKN